MDVSYSAWLHEKRETLELKGESFSFLFDRRYTNRLNRMSRVFFEAYALASKEVGEEEDRFPSLSEIDVRMESGAVYAFKDRLMKNTEFFEEVKISGVSYLVPRASCYIDSTGTYTDLVFDFEQGKVTLPSRRKTPAKEASSDTDEVEVRETGEASEEGEESEEIEKAEEETVKEPERSPDAMGGPTETEPDKQAVTIQETSIREGGLKEPEGTPLRETKEAKIEAVPSSKRATEMPSAPATAPSKGRAALARPGDRKMTVKWVGLAALAAVAIIAVMAITSPNIFSSLFYQGPAGSVQYSAQLSNSSEGVFLSLDVKNAKGMANEMEMVLPPDSDQRINAKGGVITISHSEGTQIGLTSSNDASVRVYLTEDWDRLPVTFNMLIPESYDSSLVVHGEDYVVNRVKETIVLRCNITSEKLTFEQSYNPA